MGVDMGEYICCYLDIHKNDTKHNDKKRNSKHHTPVIEECNTKSYFMIPIIIIPCHEIKLELKICPEDNRTNLLLNHVNVCRNCNINNNNERIQLNMISDKIRKYYRMTHTDEVNTLINTYQTLLFYKNRRITMIKICDKINKYYGCYFIVGKLDREM